MPGDPTLSTARFTLPNGGTVEQQYNGDDPGPLVDALADALPIDAELELFPPREVPAVQP